MYPGTAHTTITQAFDQDIAYYNSGGAGPFDQPLLDFVAHDYLYQNRNAGLGAPSTPSPAGSSGPADQSENPGGSVSPSIDVGSTSAISSLIGFNDGGIEALGTLETQIAMSTLMPTGDPGIDAELQTLQNPANVISLYWDTTGDVRLTHTGNNTALELHRVSSGATSIEQSILLPVDAQSLDFDLGTANPASGDVLSVLVNGNVWQTIDLTKVPSQSHQSFALNGITSGSGTFTFQLNGPSSSSETITLDNLKITTSNHAPSLQQMQPALPSIANSPNVTNVGLSISDLGGQITDPDPQSGAGIAIVALTQQMARCNIAWMVERHGSMWVRLAAIMPYFWNRIPLPGFVLFLRQVFPARFPAYLHWLGMKQPASLVNQATTLTPPLSADRLHLDGVGRCQHSDYRRLIGQYLHRVRSTGAIYGDERQWQLCHRLD